MSDQVPVEFAAWSLVWAEEFNGPAGSPADPGTWRPETGTNPAIVHGTVHGPAYSGARGISASLDTGSPLAGGFHAYSVCWEPGRIRWYADQTPYHTVTPADLHGRPWVFDHDFYLLINVAVGGRPSQPPDRSTAFPQAMLVDYIRVYAPEAITP